VEEITIYNIIKGEYTRTRVAPFVVKYIQSLEQSNMILALNNCVQDYDAVLDLTHPSHLN